MRRVVIDWEWHGESIAQGLTNAPLYGTVELFSLASMVRGRLARMQQGDQGPERGHGARASRRCAGVSPACSRVTRDRSEGILKIENCSSSHGG